MLRESEVTQMLTDINDATPEFTEPWQKERAYGAQKVLCVVLDILGSHIDNTTSLDAWKHFLKTGN